MINPCFNCICKPVCVAKVKTLLNNTGTYNPIDLYISDHCSLYNEYYLYIEKKYFIGFGRLIEICLKYENIEKTVKQFGLIDINLMKSTEDR